MRVVASIGGDRPLSPRAKRFAVEYARGAESAKAAAITAGFSPRNAAKTACLLLKQSRVWQVIDAEHAAMKAASDRADARQRRKETAAYIAEARAEIEQRLAGLKSKRLTTGHAAAALTVFNPKE